MTANIATLNELAWLIGGIIVLVAVPIGGLVLAEYLANKRRLGKMVDAYGDAAGVTARRPGFDESERRRLDAAAQYRESARRRFHDAD